MTALLSAEALSIVKARNDGIERHKITSREQWLSLRSHDVTASVAGALFGVHEYTTLYQLWALKSGLITEDAEETAPMRRGRLLEPVAIQMLREERPTWDVAPNKNYFRDAAARIGSTPDGFAIDPERPGFGSVQFKSVESSVFRRKWRDEDGEVAPPLWIAIQATIDAYLSGASWAAIAPIVVGHGIDIFVIDVPMRSGLLEKLKVETEKFWRLVETQTAPDPDYGRDGSLIAQLNSQCDGSTIDLSKDNRIVALASEDYQLAENIKELETRRKIIRAEALDKIGAAEIATVNGEVVMTAKTVSRKGFEVKPTSFRQIQFKRSA